MKKDWPNERDCEHGQLRRSCPICAADSDYAALLARHNALVEAVKKYFKSERLEILKRAARAEVDRLIGEGE